MAISLFSINLVSALEITLDSPEEAILQQNIKIQFAVTPEETYDLKAFIGEAKKEFSEILIDGSWRSPFNYLLEAYPEINELEVRSNVLGDTSVCVRFRSPEKTSFEEKCNPIKILEGTTISENEDKKEESSEEEKTKASSSEEKEKTQEDNLDSKTNIFKKVDKKAQTESKSKDLTSEEIVLGEPDINDAESVVYSSDYQRRMILIYSFIVFCILTIILLGLRFL